MALTDNLFSYYKLNETTGTREDELGTHDLTDNNSVGYATGKIGNAADFEASSSQYLSHADHDDFDIGDNPWHAAGWLRLASIGADRAIFAKYDAAEAGKRQYYLKFDVATGELSWRVRNAADSLWYPCPASTFGAVSAATWYFVEVYHDPDEDEIGISINAGTRDTAALSGGGNAGTSGFKMGCAPAPGHYMDGLMDEWGFWKGRVLSESEIDALYNNGDGLTYPFTGEHVRWSPLRWWINRRRSGLLVPQLRWRPMPV